MLGGLLGDGFQGGRLDLAAEHAAAHQPGVDSERRRHCSSRPATITLIRPLSPKRSRSRTLQAASAGSAISRCDLGLGVAARREVELVALVDELRRRAARSTGADRRGDQRHGRGSRDSPPCRSMPLRIACRSRVRPGRTARAVSIVGGKGRGLEVARVGQRLRIVAQDRPAAREPRPRQLAADDLDARRGCRRRTPGCRGRGSARLAMRRRLSGLVVPVRDEAGDVASPQHHVGMLVERPVGALASSFLLQTARITPRSAERCDVALERQEASPSGVALAEPMPSSPSSPMTPPQSVLSRSSTRHLRDSPSDAATMRATQIAILRREHAARSAAWPGASARDRTILRQVRRASQARSRSSTPSCARGGPHGRVEPLDEGDGRGRHEAIVGAEERRMRRRRRSAGSSGRRSAAARIAKGSRRSSTRRRRAPSRLRLRCIQGHVGGHFARIECQKQELGREVGRVRSTSISD